MKNILIILFLLVVGLEGFGQTLFNGFVHTLDIQRGDTLSCKKKTGKRLLRREWLYQKIEVEIAKNDTVYKIKSHWYSFRRVSPNTRQIWKDDVLKFKDEKLVYRKKNKRSSLPNGKIYYSKLWKMNEDGKLARVKSIIKD